MRKRGHRAYAMFLRRDAVEVAHIETALADFRDRRDERFQMYEDCKAEYAALKRENEVLQARTKALEANVSKSVLRRLEFTGGTTPTYFSAQDKGSE